jgi:hypothetical protein
MKPYRCTDASSAASSRKTSTDNGLFSDAAPADRLIKPEA